MSVVVPTKSMLNVYGVDGSQVVWASMVKDDTGEVISDPGHSQMNVSVTGTVDASDVVALQGSNDNLNWFSLTDTEGAAAEFTNIGMRQVNRSALYVRPAVTGTGTVTNVTVTLTLTRES